MGPPALSPRHVPRPRLTRLLDDADGQAIVLNAPAGYGKTALAAEWLAGRERVAWYHASPASADLAAFSIGLADAAARVVEGAGKRLRSRIRVGETPEETARPLGELLARDLAAWPSDAWLVVDDYHLVADSGSVEQFVDWLLTLAPVRVLVTTRRRPAWVSARRVLYGEIVELGRDELAMTDEEVSRVVEGARGEHVQALLERAQGWPAVIGLAALASTFATPKARISDALFRYFAEEVFRREPPEVRDFMLAASVASVVDAGNAEAVVGVERPALAIAHLEAEGLLHPVGSGRLRFHPLLREFLLQKLRTDDPERAEGLYERAIAVARREGRWEDAFELAVESGRPDVAASVLDEVATALVDAGRIETIERCVQACGAHAREHPALTLAETEVLIRRGRLFEASALASELARSLPADDVHASASWYLAGRTLHLLSEDERALECHLRASECATNAHDRTNALWGATVLAAQLESDVIDRLVAEMGETAAEDLDAGLQHASARVFLGSRKGTLAGVWRSVEPFVELSRHASDPMAANSFLLAAAYLCNSRADYRRGRELGERAAAVCEDFRLGRMKRAFSLCYRVAADIGLRHFAAAEQTLDEISALGIDQTKVLLGEQRNLRTKLLLARGGVDEVLDGATAARSAEGPLASAGEYAGLVAIAAAASGDVGRGRAEAARAEQITTTVEARWYARLAELVARLHEESADDVRADARAIFAAAADAEVLDAFVIGYRACPSLLGVLGPEVRDLVVAANDLGLARKSGFQVKALRTDDVPELLLTPRELEVLELMGQGLANGDIARRLFISEKTAKVHVYHIFSKLGVDSRVQAVLAARELLGR